MYRREHRHQLSFEDFFVPFGGKLSLDNRWIKLAELFPWDELEDDYVLQWLWSAREAIPNGPQRFDHQGLPRPKETLENPG